MVWSTKLLRVVENVPVGPAEVLYAFVSLAGEPSAVDEATLDEAELGRSNRFVRSRDRRRFVLAHAALRTLLSRCLGVECSTIRYETGFHGKPRLTPGLVPLEFNLAHSGEMALLAVARRQSIGVDIEHLRDLPDAMGLADAYFSEYERRDLRSLPPIERSGAFLRCWTRKEAVIKASGQGLSDSLESLDVGLGSGSDRFLTREGVRPGSELGWSLRDLLPPPGYAAAGAVSAPKDTPPRWRELSLDDSAG